MTENKESWDDRDSGNDFEGFGQLRWEAKQKLIKGVESWLDNNNINYDDTNIPNVVSVDNINISLLSTYGGLIKIRFSGKSKWYTYSKQKLLLLIKDPINE